MMEPSNETDLVPLLQELKQGSEAAFNTLYKVHSKMLFRSIYKLVKNEEVAKELLQDLYLRVWQRRALIDLDKSFKSFLFTISKNLVFDYLRRISLDKKARVSLVQNVVEFYSNTEEQMDYKESDKLIKLAIESLTLQSRQIFQMSRVEGKTHQQISDELGISVKVVNYHITKANKEVKAYLLRHGDQAVLFFVSLMLCSLK